MHSCRCLRYPDCFKTSNLPDTNKPKPYKAKYWFTAASMSGGNEEPFSQRVPEVWTTERELLITFARLSQLLQCIAGKKTATKPSTNSLLTLYQSSSTACYQSPNASLPVFEETWHVAFLQRPLTEGQQWPCLGPILCLQCLQAWHTAGRAMHCLSLCKFTAGAALGLHPSLPEAGLPRPAFKTQCCSLDVPILPHVKVCYWHKWHQGEMRVMEGSTYMQVLDSCPTCQWCHFSSPHPATVCVSRTGM